MDTVNVASDSWTALAMAAAAESGDALTSATNVEPTEPPPAILAESFDPVIVSAPTEPAPAVVAGERATMIRPGLMVSLKSTVRGGVSYQRVDLDAADAGIVECASQEPGQDVDVRGGLLCTVCGGTWAKGAAEVHDSECRVAGREVRRWETTKIVDDPTEMLSATKARSKALAAIRALCSRTSFGLLCPSSFEATLDKAIGEARAIVAAHNATAKTTHAAIFVLKGRVASDDVEATKAIAQEVRELVNDMATGIQKLDAKAVREAADAAKQMIDLLEEEQAGKLADAVTQARKAARQIVARVEKGGEEAAIVLADIQKGAIEKCRVAFLDYDAPAMVVGGEVMPAVDVRRAAALDMGEV